MLLLPAKLLERDMKVTQFVLHPERDDLMLVNKGYVLDDQAIRQLQSRGVTHVWIHVPGLEQVQTNVDEQVARSHVELYGGLEG